MGGASGVGATVLLMLIVGSALAAPPSPTGTKRSDENIQFGNQQNKPVSVLDDDALPGAFPSSETTETEEPQKPTVDPEEEEGEIDQNKLEEDEVEEEEEEEEEGNGQQQQHHHLIQKPPPVASAGISSPSLEEQHRRLPPVVVQHLSHHRQPPRHREEMIKDLPPVALASRWRSPAKFYGAHWGMPRSSMYSGHPEDGTFPSRRRRRAAVDHVSPTVDPRKVLQVSLHALRTGHRHKRDLHDIRRIRRDLSNIDLDKLRREVDIVELLEMLARPPPHHNPGFATVTYAPLVPAPPRFAPQPKLFPDYEEEDEEDEEDEEEDDVDVGMLRQGVRPPPPPAEPVMQGMHGYPAPGGRVWRRSGRGGYGLSAVPGFKRSSAFRANTPPPQVAALNPGDVYSLAAMLGAELDPVTHRVRRVAM